jgi:predicted molibdopterin-dependent oxidoreductase YjgC
MVRMIEAAENGGLKALYIMGENPLRALPESDRVKKALQKLEFIVVQDILNNETAKIADVLLPGASLSEKDGSVTNLEGRIQSFNAMVTPPGKAKPDWEILDLVAARLGNSELYGSVEKIRNEIRQYVPIYASLNDHSTNWIKTTSAKAVFKEQSSNELISYYPVVSTEDDQPNKDYPFTAFVGSLRYHLGSGTRTQASDRIHDYELVGQIGISPQDGANLGITDDDCVIVSSKFGAVKRAVQLQNSLPANHLFVPTGFNGNDAMNLFGLSDMAKPGSTGLKTCQVKVEKA